MAARFAALSSSDGMRLFFHEIAMKIGRGAGSLANGKRIAYLPTGGTTGDIFQIAETVT